MKRFVVLTLFVVNAVNTIFADDYTYPFLVFTTSEGTETTVSVTDLSITFVDGQLVATNGDGSTSLSLATLASMKFTATGEVTPDPDPDPEPEKEESGLSIDSEATEFAITFGDDFVAPTITNPHQLALTWTSSNESVATVDADGNVTVVGTGTTVITATFAGDDTYTEGTVSYTLTVDEYDAISSTRKATTVQVYTAAGIYVGTFASEAQAKATLRKGLYIISSQNKNHKLNIK